MSALKDRLRAAMAGPPKVSQAELSRATKVSAPSVNDWLSGKTKAMKGATLLRVAHFLRVDPDWLATGRGTMRPRSGEETVNEPKRRDGVVSQIQRPEPAILVQAEEWVRVLEAAAGAEQDAVTRMGYLADVYLMLARNNGTLSAEDRGELLRRVDELAAKRQRGRNEQLRPTKRADLGPS